MRALTSDARPSLPIAQQVAWRPQPRQQDLLDWAGLGRVLTDGILEKPLHSDWATKADRLIGYGGAAGGGKTDGNVGLSALAMCAIPDINIGFFRRKLADVFDSGGAYDRSQEIIGAIPGAKYNGSTFKWTLPNASTLQFCGCLREQDRYDYKSAQFDILILDETTSFSWKIIDFLLTRNRATVKWPGHKRGYAFSVMTSNPGDIGHAIYKELFVIGERDTLKQVENPNGKLCEVVFMLALLEDNPILQERDPDYEARLEARNPLLARAMRWGDWDIAGGLFFAYHWRSVAREGRPPHIIPAFDVPSDWTFYGSVDYGFATANPDSKPFVYGLYASDTLGHLYRVDEIAAANWDPTEQITAIKELEARYEQHPIYRVGCPAMFIPKSARGPTIAEEYANAGLNVKQANTDRINGWARCILWLKDAPDGKPWFMSFDRCRHFNRQIPSLPVDGSRQDDIDRNAEDHGAEEFRHLVMSRPMPARVAEPPPDPDSAEAILAKYRKARR